MSRANFARTKPRHTAAFRSIAIAVRDWSKTIPNEPVPYPTIFTLDLAYQASPADLHWYSQILERAIVRAAVKIEERPDVRANIDAALNHAVKLDH